MNNGFYYQVLASLSRESANFNYPRFLKDLVRSGDIPDVAELQLFFAEELSKTPLDDAYGVDYFLFVGEMSILFSIYRDDYIGFKEGLALIHNRLDAVKVSSVSEIDLEGWRHYLNYIDNSAKRLMRHISIEQFEDSIDELDWSEIGPDFIYRISGLTGFVYLNEQDKGKFNKARFWLQKAISEVEIEGGLVYYLNLSDYYFADRKIESIRRIEDQVTHLESRATSSQDPNMRRLFQEAVTELQAKSLAFKFAFYDDSNVKLEENLRSVRGIEKNVDYECKNSPSFVRAFLKMSFGKFYLSLNNGQIDRDDVEDILNRAHDNINEALDIAKKSKDKALEDYNRILWLQVVCERGTKISDKEMREIVLHFRNSENYPLFVDASRHFSKFYLNQKNSQKAYEVLLDLLKRGQKWMDEGGFYLVVEAVQMINKIMVAETFRPGVSWIVKDSEDYFDRIVEIVASLDNIQKQAGAELFDRFMTEYFLFEEASHFNLKVYLRYQWQALKIALLAARFKEDAPAATILESLITKLEGENNPLSFIKADWEEFKDVPNSVRNKVLNKCISITKGDLPAAAEHLDFSYRNLRSYITFKEVNRLGNFLDAKDTNSRQLENGIRLLFFDMYKNGTIFEVVFDMPKFLVEFAKTGFSSQDLEEALDIKGTTAKKYIKIMMEVGLITHERSMGRKHFYKLRKDNVMNRLGKDQKVIAG